MRRLFAILQVLLIFSFPSRGQTGGDNTYEFLNLSTDALVTALGGINISVAADNPTMTFYNPALLSVTTQNHFSLNYVNYFAGINYGSASWTSNIEKAGRFAVGLLYLNYGTFEEADASGFITGEFRASEYALNLSWNYRFDSSFVAGVNVKPVLSQLEKYSSFGVAVDLGMLYTSKNGLTTAALAIKNLGMQITTYTGIRENLPLLVTAGVTTKPEHAPFRLSVTANNLQKYDLTTSYTDEEKEKEENMTLTSSLSENLMRHFVIGVEFIPSSSFFIAAGFNYQRRKEMAIDYRRSTVGFSSGFGIRLTSFDLTYSRSKFHLAGSVNNVSLLIKPEGFIKRK